MMHKVIHILLAVTILLSSVLPAFSNYDAAVSCAQDVNKQFSHCESRPTGDSFNYDGSCSLSNYWAAQCGCVQKAYPDINCEAAQTSEIMGKLRELGVGTNASDYAVISTFAEAEKNRLADTIRLTTVENNYQLLVGTRKTISNIADELFLLNDQYLSSVLNEIGMTKEDFLKLGNYSNLSFPFDESALKTISSEMQEALAEITKYPALYAALMQNGTMDTSHLRTDLCGSTTCKAALAKLFLAEANLKRFEVGTKVTPEKIAAAYKNAENIAFENNADYISAVLTLASVKLSELDEKKTEYEASKKDVVRIPDVPSETKTSRLDENIIYQEVIENGVSTVTDKYGNVIKRNTSSNRLISVTDLNGHTYNVSYDPTSGNSLSLKLTSAGGKNFKIKDEYSELKVDSRGNIVAVTKDGAMKSFAFSEDTPEYQDAAAKIKEIENEAASVMLSANIAKLNYQKYSQMTSAEYGKELLRLNAPGGIVQNATAGRSGAGNSSVKQEKPTEMPQIQETAKIPEMPTAAPTETPVVPTATSFMPTATAAPTKVPEKPTATQFIPTATPFVPTATAVPTNTPVIPTATQFIPTATPFVPTATAVPTAKPTNVPTPTAKPIGGWNYPVPTATSVEENNGGSNNGGGPEIKTITASVFDINNKPVTDSKRNTVFIKITYSGDDGTLSYRGDNVPVTKNKKTAASSVSIIVGGYTWYPRNSKAVSLINNLSMYIIQ